MIKRFVKLTIRKEATREFLELFEASKKKIMASRGLRHLELLRDLDDERVFITFSIWDTEEDLNAYRQSQIFLQIWEKVGELFDAEPEAHSTRHIS